jgi:hypothetical protein
MKKYNLFLSLVALMSLASCKNQETSSSSLNNTPISSSINPLGDPNVVDIVVLAGQSNMEGHTWINKLLQNTPSSMHDYYLNGFENTQIMYYCNGGSNRNEEFEPVKVGMGFDETRFGPEVGIAQKLHKDGRVRPLYIVKYALGATNLYNNLAQSNASAISDYANQLIAENQQNIGSMLANLMLLYMNGYNVLSDTQKQSLTTSQGNATQSQKSTESGISASEMTQLALQMAMLATGLGTGAGAATSKSV